MTSGHASEDGWQMRDRKRARWSWPTLLCSHASVFSRNGTGTHSLYVSDHFIVISPVSIPKFSLAAIVTTALICVHPHAFAADAGFAVEKTVNGGVTVKVNGQLFAEYVVDQANKPYLAPVFGPHRKADDAQLPDEGHRGRAA